MARNRRVILLDERFFDDIIKAGKIEVDLNGFPADAMFIGVRSNAEYDGIVLYYEHPSFEEVELGALIPSDDRVRFRRIAD